MQIPAAVLNIGADVAKDAIVVACSEGSFPVREVANQRTAVLAWLKSLPAGSRIGVESTGIYHELFAEAAHQLGFLVFLLNPKDTHHYAKAFGLRGKTDRVDAELIARMVAHEHTKRMRSSPSPGWIRDRMTPDRIGANGASPNADRPNCAGCSTWRRCRRSRRRHGGHSTSITGPRAYPAPRPSSSLLDASLAPLGRSTPTKPTSILRVSRIPSYEPIDTSHRIFR